MHCVKIGRMAGPENREIGADFETVFESQARAAGLIPIRNYHAAKPGWNGRLIAVHGNLDFHVVQPRDGRVGWFDCKTFDDDSFTYSQLAAGNREHQIERAAAYNAMRVPSGFVVWSRKVGLVHFYTGALVAGLGAGTRFLGEMGLCLGPLAEFDLGPIMCAPRGAFQLTSGP